MTDHPHLVAHGVVDDGTEDDVRVGVRDGVDDLRCLVHFEEAEVGPAGDVEQDATRPFDRRLEQRRGDGGAGGVGGAAVANRRSDPHDGGPGVDHDHLHVGEVGVDQPGNSDEIGDAAHALHEHLVGHFEGIEHARLVVRDREEPIVGDDDEGVDLLLHGLDALLGLHGPTPALEGEGPGDDADGEGPETLGDLGHDGRRARPGPTALPAVMKTMSEPWRASSNIGAVLLGRLATDLGITPRTQAPGELAPDVRA